jgi:AcrR family transcriptional regulator
MTTRTYKKVARAAGEERTRAALLSAAARAFFAGSWDRASLEAIASDAGTTKQTLLRHFGSKPKLLEAAYAEAFEDVRAQRMAVPAGEAEAAIDNLLDHYEAVANHALAIGSMGGSEAIDRLGARARALHYEWVEHAFGPWLDEMQPGTARRRRAALIAACDVHTWVVLSRDLGLSRQDVKKTLTTMINPLLKEER